MTKKNTPKSGSPALFWVLFGAPFGALEANTSICVAARDTLFRSTSMSEEECLALLEFATFCAKASKDDLFPDVKIVLEVVKEHCNKEKILEKMADVGIMFQLDHL